MALWRRCRLNMAPADLQPRQEPTLLPLWLLSLPNPSIPSPCLFPLAFSFSFFFTRSISSHFNSSRRCVSRLRRAQLFLSPQRDSSWLLPRRKFNHVFLIKAPHRRPVRSPFMQRSKCRVFACDKKHGDACVDGEWGPARADSLSCPSCMPPPPTPSMWTCFTSNI